MPSLGEKLRDERIRQGKEIRHIADQLRIGSRYLEAIEKEDWKTLPGGFFNRSFVRQYAQFLGMDVAKVEAEYASSVASEPTLDFSAMAAARDPRAKLEEERQLIRIAPITANPSSFFDRRTGLAIAALVLLAAGGGALSLVWDNFHKPAETAMEGGTARTLPGEPRPVVPAPQQPIVGAGSADPSATLTGQNAANGQTTGMAQMQTASNPESGITAGPDGVVSLNIAATELTWVEVTVDGKRVFAGALAPGETKAVSATERAKMVVGNAGGIQVQRSGKDIGPIGPRGQVRVVNVTKDAVEIVSPVKKAPKPVEGQTTTQNT